MWRGEVLLVAVFGRCSNRWRAWVAGVPPGFRMLLGFRVHSSSPRLNAARDIGALVPGGGSGDSVCGDFVRVAAVVVDVAIVVIGAACRIGGVISFPEFGVRGGPSPGYNLKTTSPP